MGTTSACAENTGRGMILAARAQNYLRVRGEYGLGELATRLYEELPPRARRIPKHWRRSSRHVGTTSACAENTRYATCPASSLRNYLRVRGEYRLLWGAKTPNPELPPRARRILGYRAGHGQTCGTTSACAENTGAIETTGRVAWNYLRVRGEYGSPNCGSIRIAELPPRARRIHNDYCLARVNSGTTSACAENTAQVFLRII